MPQIKRQKIVPYSAEAMYNLVNDIECYQEFIPWCVESRVLAKDEDSIRASLTFAKGGVKKTFTTVNRLEPHKMMEMRLLDGPFKQLEGFWQFQPFQETHCRVSLDLAFEFSTKMLSFMFGPLFNQVANTLVDVFCQRAEQVYE